MATLPVLASLLATILFTPETAEIVVAPDAKPVVRFAAEEAEAVLARAFGTSVPIVDEPGTGRVSLVLGPNRWADAAGVTTNGLVRDAYRIRTAGNAVYVVGIDDADDAHRAIATGGIWLQNFRKATLFGTYEVLERFVGARFYFPGELGTVVPKRTRFEVPETDLGDAPAYTVRRYVLYDGSPWFEGPEPTKLRNAAKTLQWWRNRQETRYLPCCHGQTKFRYMERFAESHPEYFALLPDGRRHNSPKITSPGHPGQICHTSRIWDDEIYADAKAYLTGQSAESRGLYADVSLPGGRKSRYGWGANCQARLYVDVMPQDGMIKCACPTCQAYYRTAPEVGWASELLWGNVARLANRLKAEGVRGYLSNLAYSKTRPVPKVEIPDNVIVGVAERGPWTDRDPKERAREIAEIRAWNAKIGRKVWLWTYSGKFAALRQDGIPPVTPRAIGRYYQMLEPWIFGGFEELESERALHNYLNAYVFGRVCWNPKADVDAIVDEHHRLMFGAAAPEMKAFFDTLEELWLGEVAGETIDTSVGPKSRSPSLHELFTRIYSPAAIGRFEAGFAAALGKVGADSLEGRRVALMKREILDPLARRVRDWNDMIDVPKGLARDAASTATNLVANGDFSAPKKGRAFGPWFGSATPGVTEPDAATFVSAPQSLRISSADGSPVEAVFFFRDAGKRPTLLPGRKYRLSYFVKCDLEPTAFGGGASVKLWDDRNTWFPRGPALSGRQDWIYQSFTFTSGAETGRKGMPYVYLMVRSAKGAAWFDNVRLEEVSE